jgi:hypothetical protein
MLKAGTKNFRSNRVHVGLDEVFNLGRAIASIQKHGYRDQEEMFLTHLEKVIKITDKLGLRPMMWNDFVFCLHSKTGYDKYDPETVVPKEVMARFPKNVELVYWHYGEEMTGCDDYMMRKNLEFGNPVIWCGGLMMWQLPLPDNMFSYETTEEGILAAKANGIKEMFTALWTYSKNGCDFFTTLLHLQQYAEHAYRDNRSLYDTHNSAKEGGKNALVPVNESEKSAEKPVYKHKHRLNNIEAGDKYRGSYRDGYEYAEYVLYGLCIKCVDDLSRFQGHIGRISGIYRYGNLLDRLAREYRVNSAGNADGNEIGNYSSRDNRHNSDDRLTEAALKTGEKA